MFSAPSHIWGSCTAELLRPGAEGGCKDTRETRVLRLLREERWKKRPPATGRHAPRNTPMTHTHQVVRVLPTSGANARTKANLSMTTSQFNSPGALRFCSGECTSALGGGLPKLGSLIQPVLEVAATGRGEDPAPSSDATRAWVHNSRQAHVGREVHAHLPTS